MTQEPLGECTIQRKIKSFFFCCFFFLFLFLFFFYLKKKKRKIKSQVGYLRYTMRKHRMTSDLSNSSLHDDVNWRPDHWGFWDTSLCQQALGHCRRAEKACASAVKKRVNEKTVRRTCKHLYKYYSPHTTPSTSGKTVSRFRMTNVKMSECAVWEGFTRSLSVFFVSGCAKPKD